MSIKRTLALLGVAFLLSFGAQAQKVGIKTNLLTDAALSPNLGVEFGLAKHWTLEADYQINAWKIKEHSWKHYLISPEIRWWYCEKFQGSFWGLHLLGGQYNVGNIHNSINLLGSNFGNLSDRRYEGWGLGAGIGYGYAWALAKHWNLEFEIGVGYAYLKYDAYPACVECGKKLENNAHHNYFGLTKLNLNLEYLF